MVTKLSSLNNVWKTVIGLEIHAQMNTKTKLFSVAPNIFHNSPNSSVAYFDMATPGTLPIINAKCVGLAIKAATALKCDINYSSEFVRKHYFYGDMPAGYQITQYRYPIARNGILSYLWNDSPMDSKSNSLIRKSEAKIIQIQIEQDSGKSLHDYDHNISMIDLNRAGVGLLEVVTDCSFGSSAEAVAFVKELKEVFYDCGICNGKMEKGELRVDVNVSVKHENSEILGERSEVKNINSLRGVKKAIEFESKRHIQLLEAGLPVINETRFYNPLTETTLSMRDKENVQDYRYFPEPNLPPLHLRKICKCQGSLSVFRHICVPCIQNQLKDFVYPSEKRMMLITKFKMTLSETNTALSSPGLYEFVISIFKLMPVSLDEEIINKWIKNLVYFTLSILLGELRQRLLTFESIQLNHQYFSEVITMSSISEINNSTAVKVLSIMFDHPNLTPRQIVSEHKFQQINDPAIIENIIQNFLNKNPKALEDYKSGNKKVRKFFVKNIKIEYGGLINSNILESIIDGILDRN